MWSGNVPIFLINNAVLKCHIPFYFFLRARVNTTSLHIFKDNLAPRLRLVFGGQSRFRPVDPLPIPLNGPGGDRHDGE